MKSTTWALEADLLEKCGLTTTEQEILLDLLQRQGATAGTISKRLGMKRATVYSALQSLESLSLLVKRKDKSATIFSSIPAKMVPKVLADIAKLQYQKVVRASTALETQMTQFDKLTKHQIGGYEISTVDSKDAAFLMTHDLLVEKDFSAIFDPEAVLVDPMKGYIEDFLIRTARSKNNIEDIMVEGEWSQWYIDRIDNPNHRLKILPRTYRIVTDFILADDTVYQTNYKPGDEMMLVVKHRDYYESMMSVFRFVWDKLPLVR